MDNKKIGKAGAGGFNILSGEPSGSFWSKWFGGLIIPVLFVAFAMMCWIDQTATIPSSKGSGLRVTGIQAIAMGFVWLSMAVFLFCNFFVKRDSNNYWRADNVKKISLAGFIISLGYVLISVLSKW